MMTMAMSAPQQQSASRARRDRRVADMPDHMLRAMGVYRDRRSGQDRRLQGGVKCA
jgi:hypothetical protein